MENLGDYLQQARKAKKLSIDEMAGRTRISPRFIRAIEENRFDLLPNMVSAKGFVKGYALCLELDIDEVLDAFSELVESEKPRKGRGAEDKPPPYIQAGRPDRLPFPSWTVMSVGALILFLLILTVVLPKKGVEEDEPSSPETTSLEEVISPEVPQVLGPPVLETGDQDGELSEVGDVSEEEENPLPEAGEELPLTATAPLSDHDSGQKPDDTPDLISDEPATPSVLLVEAVSSSWVQVTLDGDEIQEAMLQPEDTVRWRAKESFFLTLGNAGGVRVYLDGKDLGPMGPIGKVVRKKIIISEALSE
ncbi:MAG: RodZ domain-containing protein [Nitrospira sp.]|nr:helix-turn-helix domain-containing protein [Candidatus Manganitrophaceae bacterium]HIL34934.1 helix-turn-helix domain-containing protein [Candidatus Manganitrophaceae bacterium]